MRYVLLLSWLALLTVGVAEAQTRDTSTMVSDSWINTKIKSAFFLDEDIKSRTIDVDTVKGVVTLTGTVATEAERDEALAIARTIDGVEEVVDRLEVDPTAVPTSGTETTMGDGWITTKIQAKYFGDSLVKARRIDIDTDQGVVTLTGTVETDAERARAVELAEQTDGVVRVEDRLMLAAGGDADRRQEVGTAGDEPETGLRKEAAEGIERLTQSDAAILTQIKTKLALDTKVSAFEIDVDVDERIVTLTGSVEDEAARTRALDIARSVTGVREVRDRLSIEPQP